MHDTREDAGLSVVLAGVRLAAGDKQLGPGAAAAGAAPRRPHFYARRGSSAGRAPEYGPGVLCSRCSSQRRCEPVSCLQQGRVMRPVESELP